LSKFEDIPSCLTDIEARYNESEKTRKKLAKFHDPIELTFLDTGRKVLIILNGDEGIEIKDNTGDDTAVVKIEFEAEKTLIDLFNKEIGAVKAYSSGQITVVEGKIRNLLKLKSLLF